MISMNKFARVLVLAVILCPLIAACAGNTEFSIVDLREKLGKVFKEKTGEVDNSKGTSDLNTDINAKRDFRYTIDLKLNSDANLDEKAVKDKIMDTYDISDPTGTKSCVIPAQVPAGNIYAYDIEWTEVTHEGNVVSGKDNPNGDI